jgi:hypothetical protein
VEESSGWSITESKQRNRHHDDHHASAEADELKRPKARIAPADQIGSEDADDDERAHREKKIAKLPFGNHRRRL